MVKLKYIRVIILVIIKLGVVMCLHELCAAEFIHHRRNSGDRDGKIIRPGLDRALDAETFRVDLFCVHRKLFYKFLQKILIFIGRPDRIPRIMRIGRKLKIQVRDHLSLPFRPDLKDLLPCPRRPVVLGVFNSPLFRRHTAEYNGLFRLITDLQQRPCDPEHQRDRTVVILESVKIGIIVTAEQDHIVRLSRDRSPYIVGRHIFLHDRLCIKLHCNPRSLF